MFIANQTYIFLYSFILGMALAFLYDFFRITRTIIRLPTVIIFVEDVIYFVICAVVTFFYMLSISDGQIRFFILFGELLGAIIYYFTIGILIMKTSKIIIEMVKAIITFIYKIFIRPIFRLLVFIIKILLIPFKKIRNILKNYSVKAKFRLKQKRLMLYNLYKGVYKKKRKEKGVLTNET